MNDLAYSLIDCDNHYYEVDDCFTRHIETKFKNHTIHVDRSRNDGIGIMKVADERMNFFSAAVGDHVGPPGAMKAFFKGDTDLGGAVNLNPLRGLEEPEFVNRQARLQLMDKQNVEACLMIPTLGCGAEYQLRQAQHRHAMYPSLRAFNRWLAEDWGWGSDGRVFSSAMISLIDVNEAVTELERLIAEGCKAVYVNTGPIDDKSPADTQFDPFWARMEEAEILCVFHIGNTPFNEIYASHWGEPANPPSHRFTGMNMYLGMGERTITDQIAAMIYHDLFGRFPELRCMIVEFGASWAPHLLKTLDKIYRLGDHKTRWRNGKPELPSEVFKRNFKIVPFHEDDFAYLAKHLGVDCIVNGSDFPHPEGLLWPAEMAEEMQQFNDADIRKMMRSNAASWLQLNA